MPVRASVGASCGFASGAAPSGTKDVGDVSLAFQEDFPFTLECTGPVRAAVISANGALVAPAALPLPTGYTNAAPYQVVLHMEGDAGVTPVTGACGAETLAAEAASPCAFRGPSSETQGLRLTGSSWNVTGSYLRVQSPGYSGGDILAASDGYADTLTVTLTPSP